MKQIKSKGYTQSVGIIVIILLLVYTAISSAIAVGEQAYAYQDGTYRIELTGEEYDTYASMYQTVLDTAPEILIITQYSLEDRVKQTENLTEDERAIYTIWGLPDDTDITQEDALYLAYAALKEVLLLSDNDLETMVPSFAFEVTDPDQAMWYIKFMPFDRENNNNRYRVKVYAQSGDIAEIAISDSVG